MEKRSKRPEEAFLDGYKPAIFTYECRAFLENKAELLQYPHLNLNRDELMIFQDIQRKNDFQELMREVDQNSYIGHYVLGVSLGFPIPSVRRFAHYTEMDIKMGSKKERRRLSMGVNWAGFQFETYTDLMEHDVIWLWHTYHHPHSKDEMMTLWDTDFSPAFKIEYGDVEKLREAKLQIMKLRDFNSNQKQVFTSGV